MNIDFKKKSITTVAAIIVTALMASSLNATEHATDNKLFNLYKEGTVRPLGVPETRVLLDEVAETLIFNVSEPTLELFRPEPGNVNGAAVIIAPGGGFVALSYEQGGRAIARRLAEHGITALVLKYRTLLSAGDPMILPEPHLAEMAVLLARQQRGVPVEVPEFVGEAKAVEDGTRAIELVRQHAAEWGVDPNRVGMLGLSAGAFITVDLAIGEDVSRPDFIGLLYGGLRSPVPADAPPAFIAAAADDEFLANDSLSIFASWRAVGAPAELHIYEKGGHGFDLRQTGTTSDEWLDQFIKWMRTRKFL